MDLKEIRQIIEMMKRNDLSLFHLEREGFKIKLRKGVDFDTMVDRMGAPGYGHPPAAPVFLGGPGVPDPVVSPGDDSAEGTPGTAHIKSPMVGTFYRSAGPGEKVFVNVGDTVEEGSTVCIIEAMKVMNEIKAEVRGVITRTLVEDSTAVQYDTPLFEVRPA